MINLADPAMLANPYPTYERLRADEPVTKVKLPFIGHVWVVTQYHDVAHVLSDPRLANDRRNTGFAPSWLGSHLTPQLFQLLQNSMVSQDAPNHRRLRGLVHQAFTPRRMEQLTGQIEQLVDQLLDQLATQPTVDLIADFALALPLTVISDMLGVAPVDRLKFHQWSGSFLEAPSGGAVRMVRELPNGYRMLKFFERLLKERRTNPRDDLVTALVQAEAEGQRLSQNELLSMIFLLLLAGHETSVNLIGNGVLALLEHPDQLALLRERPELIDSAVEELLRYGNPVQQTNYRYARKDFELHGQRIRRGDAVLPLIAAANHDERVFINPDQLDITRSPNKHLAFGHGIHYCLGAPLARIEGRVAILKLIERFPQLHLAVKPDQLRWRTAIGLRGLINLPINLH